MHGLDNVVSAMYAAEHAGLEEVDSVLGHDLSPTAAEYTEKVFAESMRLYPPAWAISRVSCKMSVFSYFV